MIMKVSGGKGLGNGGQQGRSTRHVSVRRNADQQGHGTRHVLVAWAGKCDGCSKSIYWICYEATVLEAR
jgi:hypothetical protein